MTTLSMITTIIVALITAVIGPLIVTWVQLKLASKSKISPVKEAIDLNELVSIFLVKRHVKMVTVWKLKATLLLIN
jgi:hypothetical protein